MSAKYVYVLALDKRKVYVGVTQNLRKRWEQHCEGVGADWTRIYKPRRMVYWEKRKNLKEAMRRENILTKILATKGFDVRGGAWCKVNERPPVMNVIYLEFCNLEEYPV